jgi:hypothetical protein
MPGKLGLGPLEENAATLGASTPFPTTLTVCEILTTGDLQRHREHASICPAPWKEQVRVQRELKSHSLRGVCVGPDPVCDLVVHEHAGKEAIAHVDVLEGVAVVLRKD